MTLPQTRLAFLAIADHDPNLALVGLRIEIEKRLRALASKYDVKPDQSIGLLLNLLHDRAVLDSKSAAGLEELIKAGNRAAHGATVESEVASWAFETGPQILRLLDLRLAEDVQADIENWINKATLILDFENETMAEMATSVLNMARRDGHVMLMLGDWSPKMRAAEILIKLGALAVIEDSSRTAWSKYRITPQGNALLSHLLAR